MATTPPTPAQKHAMARIIYLDGYRAALSAQIELFAAKITKIERQLAALREIAGPDPGPK